MVATAILRKPVCAYLRWRARRLMTALDYDRAEGFLLRLWNIDKADHEAITLLGRIANARFNLDDAIRWWARAFEASPDDVQAAGQYAFSLMNGGDNERARAIAEDLIKRHPDRIHGYRILALCLCQLESFDEAETLLKEIPHPLREKSQPELVLARVYAIAGQFQKAADILSEAARAPDADGSALHQLAEAQILCGQPDEAVETINRLRNVADDPMSLRLQAWMDMKNGDRDAAAEKWRRILERQFIAQVHATDFQVRRLDDRPLPKQTDEIRAFLLVQNEMRRLPYIMDYHRNLGVDRFFVVDNGSNDGTLEFLLSRNDTHVFYTTDEYSRTGSGLRFVHHVLDRFGDGHWCLIVDADECFVYPGCEQADLKALAGYLDEQGHEGVGGFMIDMYSDRPFAARSENETEDYLRDYPYFDADYDFHPWHTAPYFRAFGGVRPRVLDERRYAGFVLQKIPFVRWSKDTWFLSSTHYTTPLVISDVHAALLHFKFIDDLAQESLSRKSAQKRTRGGYYEVLYAETVRGRKGRSFKDDASVKYRDSRQLVELGLLKSSSAYEAFLKSRK